MSSLEYLPNPNQTKDFAPSMQNDQKSKTFVGCFQDLVGLNRAKKIVYERICVHLYNALEPDLKEFNENNQISFTAFLRLIYDNAQGLAYREATFKFYLSTHQRDKKYLEKCSVRVSKN
jgi:hypothetical protein